jgi:hypothetical protein
MASRRSAVVEGRSTGRGARVEADVGDGGDGSGGESMVAMAEV